jgi:UDP-N-acetylmuramate dehydrogenase
VSRNASQAAPSPAPRRAGPGADAADLTAAVAEIARQSGIRCRRNELLAGHTTIRVGGPADLLAAARDVPALTALVRAVRGGGMPLTILGRGSNVVVADAGVRGMVVLSRAEGCRIDGDRLTAEAGLPLARAATLAQRAGLSGLEFGLAIPGTVGGAVWANAGAHGADVAGVLESVTLLRADGGEATEPAAALSLAYRESRFKHAAGERSTAPTGGHPTGGHPTGGHSVGEQPAGDLILTATFRLMPADPAAIKARLDDIRRWRQEHQPLSQPSAGSVFRNPPGDSAGRLIDACGLKGTRLGGAAISAKHANFIVNEGGATAADVRRLAELARKAVVARFGIELSYEVQFIGDWSDWQP